MSIYHRLILLMVLLIMGAVGSILVVVWSQNQTNAQVHQERARAEAQTIAQIMALHSAPFVTFVADYTIWDEMVQQTQTCDPSWASNNLAPTRTMFDADAIAVFRRDGSRCYATDPTLDLSPAALGLGSSPSTTGTEIHAFYRLDTTVWEIAAATIHPTADTTRATAPQGWFVVAHRLDDAVLAELGALLKSQVVLEATDAPDLVDQHGSMERFHYPLRDPQGTPVAVLTMISSHPLISNLEQVATVALVIIVTVNLLTFGLISLGLTRWVVTPLRILTGRLQGAPPAALAQLGHAGGEFGQLARLVHAFFTQHEVLRQEVEARRQAEATLRSFFDSAGVLMGIVELSADDILHIADNQVTADFFGTTVEALRGQWASALGVPPATIQIWRDAYQESARIGKPVQFDYVHTTPDGPCWLAATVCAIGATTHGSRHYSYVVTDVTARKVVAQQLELANVQLRALAHTDGLTGLSNRAAFDTYLAEAVARATSDHAPLVLVMIDLDCFKHYNDTYGHVAGDEVLRTVAQIFRAQTRQRDMTARYGGDEFAIILPNTDEPAAMLVAERIRWDVEQTLALQCAIKISLGVAIFAPPMTVAQFIELADRALYRAKTQGRNLVVNARQLSQDVR